MSLATMPEVRTSGAFGDDSDRLEWVQPRDLYQGQLYHHAGTIYVNGLAIPFEPWDLVIVPPNSRCQVIRQGSGTHVYDYFTFVPFQCEQDVMAIPMLSRLGEEGKFWDANLRRALNRQILSRTSVQVVVASLLWAISQPAAMATGNVFVEQAEAVIQDRLHTGLRVSLLAKDLSISQSQLNRLFLSEHGQTPMQYIRDQRAQLAQRLLSQSTMPIKQIAVACGFPDLHAFNRFVRDRLGASPRAVRLSRGEVDIYRARK
jgi:AraC-like DNA-binding protein